MTLTSHDDCSLELTFNRHWRHVSVLRAFVQNFVAVNMTDASSTSPEQVAMALSELMENAVKYSQSEAVSLSLFISSDGPPFLRATVQNEADEESVRRVREQYDRAMQGDPLETYIEMMRESVTRGDSSSQLGLIRIRYESGCRLGLTTSDTTVSFSLEF